eukprot:TRINITY_DN12012_c0_g1_i1.p3 TRINITY_DN12012_c0_g1~~TRINITY_DN12012_c0_g1_i1.p3  ORF type:complete len:51 (+),score=4.87 TRINITY_DN12012_c0_g1_i1:365-517(+)
MAVIQLFDWNHTAGDQCFNKLDTTGVVWKCSNWRHTETDRQNVTLGNLTP